MTMIRTAHDTQNIYNENGRTRLNINDIGDNFTHLWHYFLYLRIKGNKILNKITKSQ